MADYSIKLGVVGCGFTGRQTVFAATALPCITAVAVADLFHYKLAVEDEGRRHTVKTGDVAVPEALRPLIQRLTAMTCSTRRS